MFGLPPILIVLSIFSYNNVHCSSSPTHHVTKRQSNRVLSCAVPAVFPDKTYLVYDFNGELIENAAPGSRVFKGTYLELQCSQGYSYEDGGHMLKSYCDAKGEWQPAIKPCARLCPALQAPNVELTCKYGGRDIDCNKPLRSGTVVIPRCKPFHHVSQVEPALSYTSLRCREDGQWNEILFKCDPDCGVKPEPPSTGGGNKGASEIPWNVAIYSAKGNQLKCSGTLIAPNAVLSASHCFYNEKETKMKMEPIDYVVKTSKILKNYKNTGVVDSTQETLKISEILQHGKPNDLQAEVNGHSADMVLIILQKSVTISSHVLPACLKVNEKRGFDPGAGKEGLLAGWASDAKDKSNDKLQIVQVTSIPSKECSTMQTELPFDKLCAFRGQGSVPMNSFIGGGLVFKDPNQQTYSVRGVLSTAGLSKNTSVTLFTDISYYQDWIDGVLQEKKDCEGLPTPQYRGCYEVTDKSSLLIERFSNFSNTPESCVEFCSVRNYPFAGLEKQQCRCGYHVPSELQKRSDSECNYPCQASSCQSTLMCGGKSKVSIYETGVGIAADAIASRTYLGCFIDDQPNARVINGTWSPFYCDNSPKKCHQYCFDTGFRYFGLTNFHECFCGDTGPAVHAAISDSECRSACSGDAKEMCGGGWRLSVYLTGITDQPEVGRFVGCHKKPSNELKEDVKFPLSPISITNRKCLNLCTFRGYKYSAVVDQYQCSCTNTAPALSSLDDSLKCEKQECLGDPTQMCGDIDHIKVYRTRYENTTSPEKIERMGCYEDRSEFGVIDDYVVSVDESLSGELCADICKNKGFAFSGVKMGNQCSCGNTCPPSFSLSPESNCAVPCVGNPSQKCGGASAVSAYRTGLSHKQARASKVYVGCFKDDELFKGFVLSLKNNAPNVCHRLCLKNGFLFFGVKSAECMCGDEDPSPKLIVPESECKKECVGNANKKCGGAARLSVYRTGLEALLPNKTQHLGCYPSDGQALHEYSALLSTSNTPTRCYRICDQMGFSYAGTENGNICRCGNDKPKQPAEKDDKKCDSKCSGSSAETCGGNNYLKILQTGRQS